MKTGQTIQVTIEQTLSDGYGCCAADGMTLLVPGGASGDRLQVRVDHVSPHRAQAWCTVLEVVERGEQYLEPACPHAWPTRGSCGGCPLAHLSNAAYTRVKTARVESVLGEAGVDVPLQWHDAPSRLRYRNRCNYVATRGHDGKLLLGSRAPRSDRVVPMDGCLALREPLAAVAAKVAAVLREHHVPVHPEPEGLRYLTVRHFNTGGVHVDLVVNREEPRWPGELAAGLGSIADVCGVSLTVNADTGNAIRQSGARALWGEDAGIERIGAYELSFTAWSFAQLNTSVAEQMYAASGVSVQDGDMVWDLYCGAGGFGLCATAHRENVQIYGAESVEGAVVRAAHNARLCARDAAYEAIDLARPDLRHWPAPDVVFVNPPRRGMHAALLSILTGCDARTIVYMSCSPTSFGADAAQLTDAGWKLECVDAWDMLPQTSHAELLGVFKKD